MRKILLKIKFKTKKRRALSYKKADLLISLIFISVLLWPKIKPSLQNILLHFRVGSVYAAGSTTYTTSGTWIAPANVYYVVVEARGGGAAGSPGGAVAKRPGGGGGGGAYTKGRIAVTPGNSYTITVGGQVTSGDGNNSQVVGDNSQTVNANPGTTTSGNTGGSGGAAQTVNGYILASYNGGNGGTAANSNDDGGGGGGEGGGSTAAGGDGQPNSTTTGGAGGTGTDGGDGGAGGNNGAGGNTGTAPGGGGGGSGGSSNVVGVGARGEVSLSWNESPTVTLNTPLDSSTIINVNPTFNFTGYDAELNSIEYNIQIDTSSSFNSQGGNPLFSKFSTTDSGFTSGHPYTSGSAVEYTVPSGSELDYGTYYWRVRGIDSAPGSDSYGAWATYRTLVLTETATNFSGKVYQTNESSYYDCSGGNSLTIYLKINGAGSFTGSCTSADGDWEVNDLTGINSGNTLTIYTYGGSVRGSTILVSNDTAQSNIPIIQNRVVLRDDVNGNITNTEILAGDTTDSDDLISFSGSNLTVGSSYEIHIYSGHTYAPGANVTTGKIHIPSTSTYTGSTETLTLTGSGTGTSRPLYIDGGTFTPPSTIQFQGTSATDINNISYTNLKLNPTITGATTYTFLGSSSVAGDFTIDPTSTSSNTLTVTMAGNITVANTGTIYIQGTDSGLSNLDTTSVSSYTLSTGYLDISAGGTLTANSSDIYLTGTSSTIFSNSGTFSYGQSNVIYSQTTGNTTLNSGSITFYDLTINMSGQTGTTGGNIIVSNNLTISAGTMSVPSTYTLSVTGSTGITGTLSISSSGNQSFTGNVTINEGGVFTNSSNKLNIDGNLIITGTFTSPSGTANDSFTLAGNFTKTGTFNHNNGQITLDTTGTSQLDYSSDTTFYQFSVLTAGKTVEFDETYTIVVANDITIQGSDCSTGRIFLDSMVNADKWAINIQTGATQDIDYINLEDADGSGSEVTPTADNTSQTPSTNTGWSVSGGVCVPSAPTNVSATDGTYTNKVTVTWTKSDRATGYKVYEGTNLLDTLGDVATYDDLSAPSPTISAGTASASDGTNSSYVILSLNGESANNGSSRTYKVVAFNTAYEEDSSDSNTDGGYRGVGVLTYQWQRSAADSDENYSNISGATTDPYFDTESPENEVGRYFRCYLSAEGAESQYSTSDRGYRKLSGTQSIVNFEGVNLNGINVN